MKIAAEHLDALAALGYDDREARFLYLVATHSGFFTIQQFTHFAGQSKGRPAFRFTQKLLQRKHARAIECARQTLLYDVYSRRIYGRIGKDNLRNRRHLSKELIHTRLLILDFVLGHLDCDFLETEAVKVSYFHQALGIPSALLPGRIYKGLRSNTKTARYFVDRFPVFFSSEASSPSASPVSFTYCDLEARDLVGFISHLKNYERFLRRLPKFEFIYACPNSEKFRRARKFFHEFFDLDDAANIENTLRYFEVRRLWEEKKYNSVDRVGRDLLRWAKQHPRQEILDAAYQKWVSGNLSATEITGVLKPVGGTPQISFSTYLLPRRHDLFESFSPGVGGTGVSRRRSAIVPLPFRPTLGKNLMEKD